MKALRAISTGVFALLGMAMAIGWHVFGFGW
jgi:hypothetical protein